MRNTSAPRVTAFEDAKRSISVVKANGGFASINYFIFPGFTDQESEWNALRKLISETRLDLIQMRNLNIDPGWYLAKMSPDLSERKLGIRRLISHIRNEFQNVKLGYFNPPLD